MPTKATYEISVVRVVDNDNAELKSLQNVSVFHDNVYYFLLGSSSWHPTISITDLLRRF